MSGALWLCETVTAGPRTQMHVRELGLSGPKLSGGADTPALCGMAVAWDVREVEEMDDGTTFTCTKCMAVMKP